ncbi:hypothetical protein QUF90_01440 [Desulfococcaceae bacterium HSG9]|nr:hypothetical protein [Desulfococcaceae bacterium HSG9]
MNSKRCFIFAISILSVTSTVVFSADRGIIRNTADLSHASGKPGTFRALVIIGIDDYKDPAIPDLQTAVNDAKAIGAVLKNASVLKSVTCSIVKLIGTVLNMPCANWWKPPCLPIVC